MGDNLPSNRTLPPVGLWRWNQYLTPPQWVPFTGGVSEQGITQVQITDGVSDAGIDASTATLQTIEYEHHEIHSGSAFLVWDRLDISGSAVQDYSIITPNTKKWGHFVLEAISEGEMCVQIYEAAALTAGTPLVAYNRNRNSSTAATIAVSKTPTSITPGSTIIVEDQWGSGKQVGGGTRGLEEFVLKQGTKYLVRFTNLTASVNYLTIHLNWYEHTDKN